MKKYSKPMLDIIEFDNLDVIVMSETMSDANDMSDDRILEELPTNQDAVVTPAEHEESVESTLEEGSPMEDPTPEPEQSAEEPVEEPAEHEGNSASDDTLS